MHKPLAHQFLIYRYYSYYSDSFEAKKKWYLFLVLVSLPLIYQKSGGHSAGVVTL